MTEVLTRSTRATYVVSVTFDKLLDSKPKQSENWRKNQEKTQYLNTYMGRT